VTSEPSVEVRTERLRLRRITERDLPAWHLQVFSDPEVMRYLPSGAPVPMARTREVFQRFEDAWGRRGFGPWGVEIADTGVFAGHCGLREVEELPGEVEVLYALGREHWGRGYATEAARASVRFGFDRLGLERVLAFAVPGNVASRRVMEKMGMVYERRARLFGIETVVYRLDRDRFDPANARFEVAGGGAVTPPASPRARDPKAR
jgi:RimJ/RimL family protein N-acetyltransferase